MSDTAITVLCYASWAIGLVALAMLPVRTRGAFALLAAWRALKPANRVLAALSLVALGPALCLWFVVLLSLMAFVILWIVESKNPGAPVLAGMLMPLLAIQYLIIEALFIAPRRQLKRKSAS